MKISYTSILISLTVILGSCSENSASEKQADGATSISGRWHLQKAEKDPATEKAVAYKDQPTDVILRLEKNGYFILYDTFTDPKWKSKGLPLITERSKGQWEQKNDKLILNHNTKDTSYSEELELSKIDEQTLVTRGKDKKSTVYKTYTR